MLKAIRREMCHGQGCSGIRHPIERDNDSLSSVEMYSDTSDIEIPYIVSPQTFKLKQNIVFKNNWKCFLKFHLLVKVDDIYGFRYFSQKELTYLLTEACGAVYMTIKVSGSYFYC